MDERNVTYEMVEDAALRWCGQKDRETFPADMEYFRHNWRVLPGLRKFVLPIMEPSE